MTEPARTDAELVAASRGGDRTAFRQMVERYQTLVCSIAFSATGSVSRSEDVAQETFLAAWRTLGSLREPGKLRAWLCGITRNMTRRDLRDARQEPVRHAVEMSLAPEAVAPEATPSDQAVAREEEAMMWRTLASIPEEYREPLVLFYREHRSVAEVAAALELTEDAAKQRLSRGRRLLQAEIEAMVESTLRRTAPGRAFSEGVIALLPATAGTVTATGWAGKGVAAATPGLGGGWLAAATPWLGIAMGVGAHWLVIREDEPDPRARRIRGFQMVLTWAVWLGAAVGGEWLVHRTVLHYQGGARVHFAALALFWWSFIAVTLAGQILLALRWQRRRAPDASAAAWRPRTLAAVVAGVHLALFSWLGAIAWRSADAAGAAVTAGAMLLLGVLAYRRCLGRSGAALAQAAAWHVTAAGAAILLILNWRLVFWLADGGSVADVRSFLPLWLVPVLTLALVGWVGALAWFMRRATSRRTP